MKLLGLYGLCWDQSINSCIVTIQKSSRLFGHGLRGWEIVCRDGFVLISQRRGSLNYTGVPAQRVHGEGATEAMGPYILDARRLPSSLSPATIDQFRKLCAEKGIETSLRVPAQMQVEPMLFDMLGTRLRPEEFCEGETA
jgi:hypothetical protein